MLHAVTMQKSNPFGTLPSDRTQDMPPTAAQVAELISSNRQLSRQLEALPAQIAAALQAPKPADSISDDERAALEEAFQATFPAMSPGCPRRASAADFVVHVRAHAPNSAAADLLRIGDSGIDHAKRLGKLLHRADGLVIGVYFLQAEKKRHGTTVWMVTRVSNP